MTDSKRKFVNGAGTSPEIFQTDLHHKRNERRNYFSEFDEELFLVVKISSYHKINTEVIHK